MHSLHPGQLRNAAMTSYTLIVLTNIRNLNDCYRIKYYVNGEVMIEVSKCTDEKPLNNVAYITRKYCTGLTTLRCDRDRRFDFIVAHISMTLIFHL
ncbi:hypothetical protein DICVIV_04361 [Dictyocaulus viviparus]|uniref:Uncharacterized protein n=1 Tax=Dictyocaulus viviparus TaxID=29172 RepID=A0A0D8Y065_DICVI|nr:hypothetical protein DICVIV_04361 [Dictyocaulus viviparus]